MPQAPETLNTFEALIQVIRDLRGPEGCPWDKEQTHKTLAPFAIEETFEMVEALEIANDEHICEELGDMLFQVILHAQLAEERGAFKINNVIESIVSKIVRRHPHVFSDSRVANSAEVIKNWDEIKKIEKKNKNEKVSALQTPIGLPALQRAYKIGEKTNKYKFDWSESKQVLQQLKAEIIELEEAIEADESIIKKSHVEHEMGDVLFSAAQVARHLGIEPESNLRKANSRFTLRFEKMLETCGGLENFLKLTSSEKESLWSKVKLDLSEV